MRTRRKQHGWINLPSRFFDVLFVLAGVGLLALVFGLVWAVYWLVSHVRFV